MRLWYRPCNAQKFYSLKKASFGAKNMYWSLPEYNMRHSPLGAPYRVTLWTFLGAPGTSLGRILGTCQLLSSTADASMLRFIELCSVCDTYCSLVDPGGRTIARATWNNHELSDTYCSLVDPGGRTIARATWNNHELNIYST